MADWRTLVRQQHAELEKLEAMDAELNDDKISADIEKALRKTSRVTTTSTSAATSSSSSQHHPSRLAVAIGTESRANGGSPKLSRGMVHGVGVSYGEPDYYDDGEESPLPTPAPIPSRGGSSSSSSNHVRPASANATARATSGEPMPRSPVTTGGSALIINRVEDDDGAPETTARYHKARLKMLSKQLEDSLEMRKQLTDTVNDLQRQLNNEREENKKQRKRIQMLETEQKRSSGRRASEGVVGSAETIESLQQEVATLKKDMQTAERIAKQADALAKAKETHLKRALETIARLKNQVAELQSRAQDGTQGERSKLDATEARVKLLERQRADLITAFKKQMKLIDVLKRQKVHIEAARLLSFTEEEFVRTLDWGL